MVDCIVETDAQLKTPEEEAVWDTFLKDFERYLTGEMPADDLTTSISKSRQSRLSYLSWAMLGALIGALLGMIWEKFTGQNMFPYFILIPSFTILFLRWRINQVKVCNP